MATHVEKLRQALDAYDAVRSRMPSRAPTAEADALADRVRELLQEIEGIGSQRPS